MPSEELKLKQQYGTVQYRMLFVSTCLSSFWEEVRQRACLLIPSVSSSLRDVYDTPWVYYCTKGDSACRSFSRLLFGKLLCPIRKGTYRLRGYKRMKLWTEWHLQVRAQEPPVDCCW